MNHESYDNCDFCKVSWGANLVQPSHVLTTAVVLPSVAAISTSFVCLKCITEHGLSRAVQVFCQWQKEEYGAVHVDPLVVSMEGMEGTLEEVALEMREYHENQNPAIKQRVQSRHESSEQSQSREGWYLSKVPLTAFLL